MASRDLSHRDLSIAELIRITRLCTRCGWAQRKGRCGCRKDVLAKPWPEGAWRTIPDFDANPWMAQRIIDAAVAMSQTPAGEGLSAGQLIWHAYNELETEPGS